MQARGIDDRAGIGTRQIAERDGLCGCNTDITRPDTVLVDNGAAADDQIIGGCHVENRICVFSRQRL